MITLTGVCVGVRPRRFRRGWWRRGRRTGRPPVRWQGPIECASS